MTDLQIIQENIFELERRIAALPIGSVGKKNVKGRTYFYQRWYEGGKRREKYVPEREAAALEEDLKERRRLEKELKRLRGRLPADFKTPPEERRFTAAVRTGEALRRFAEPVRDYKKRECFKQLQDYVYGKRSDRVLILYGLRRTGKTTLIRQLIGEMDEAVFSRTAFIQIAAKDTLASLNRDFQSLEAEGFRYLFIDEAILMEDFIGGSALFSDIYAASGLRIVLSGTDSLGFMFSEDEQLYDRCIMLHTTFIPYREFERVLGICGIDEYIRYGGTMSLGGVNYNGDYVFADKKNADEYVDGAIARNIQHSLRCYRDGGHFRHLYELYEKDELTNAVNRIVEDINHRFTLEVLTRDFRSGDIALSQKNLRRDRAHPTDVLDRIDLAEVTERLRRLLEIRNLPEQSVPIEEAHIAEIKEYLSILDFTFEIEVMQLAASAKKIARTVLSQPGVRYAQANALVGSLLTDGFFGELPLSERNYVLERILNEIKGRMTEDIILLETAVANPEKQVFVLQFAVGEFDMVIFDPAAASCEIFEIKHSREIDPNQYRHLIDSQKCAAAELRYGPIKGKYVLYRGEAQTVEGIRYLNIESYLRSL